MYLVYLRLLLTVYLRLYLTFTLLVIGKLGGILSLLCIFRILLWRLSFLRFRSLLLGRGDRAKQRRLFSCVQFGLQGLYIRVNE